METVTGVSTQQVHEGVGICRVDREHHGVRKNSEGFKFDFVFNDDD